MVLRAFWCSFRAYLGGKKGGGGVTCSLIDDLPTYFGTFFLCFLLFLLDMLMFFFVFFVFFVVFLILMFMFLFVFSFFFLSEVICVDFELTNCLSNFQK